MFKNLARQFASKFVYGAIAGAGTSVITIDFATADAFHRAFWQVVSAPLSTS